MLDGGGIAKIKKWLAAYNGPDISVMEVCGSHTAAISKYGIASMLSGRLHLLSGPGCPVCVAPTAYIDRLVSLAMEKDTTVVTFGDLLRVPGSAASLSSARGEGASVEMVYAPHDVISLAKADAGRSFVFAAVGFETTAPVYAMLLERLIEEGIENVRLLTALKTMPPAIEWLCTDGGQIDAFLAPGHVAAVIGSRAFEPLAERFCVPFAVAGFGAEELLAAVYGAFRAVCRYRDDGVPPGVKNYYPSVVAPEGNVAAKAAMERYFKPVDAAWRGIGVIPGSGLALRDEYARYDAGSIGLDEDRQKNAACLCGDVLTGRHLPGDCPLYGKACTPMDPQGACMVSEEGSCRQYFAYHRGG